MGFCSRDSISSNMMNQMNEYKNIVLVWEYKNVVHRCLGRIIFLFFLFLFLLIHVQNSLISIFFKCFY